MSDWINIVGWAVTLGFLTWLGGYIRYRTIKERDEE